MAATALLSSYLAGRRADTKDFAKEFASPSRCSSTTKTATSFSNALRPHQCAHDFLMDTDGTVKVSSMGFDKAKTWKPSPRNLPSAQYHARAALPADESSINKPG